MEDNTHTDTQSHSWKSTLTEVPYAADAIRNRRPVLDTRRHIEALADGERVGFIVREEAEYHVVIEMAELDQTAPGWRKVLEALDDRGVEGYWELIAAVQERMTDRNEVATAQWIAVVLVADDPDD